jgi:hypothetical protein
MRVSAQQASSQVQAEGKKIDQLIANDFFPASSSIGPSAKGARPPFHLGPPNDPILYQNWAWKTLGLLVHSLFST